MLLQFPDIIEIFKLQYKPTRALSLITMHPVTPEEISPEYQSVYCAGDATHLYLIDYLRSNIANVVRELIQYTQYLRFVPLPIPDLQYRFLVTSGAL
jgi:hypothetical protein